ncbi:ARID/BRIGHT DNA binding domain containing protein [Acanthamoeba castellanii str. Neff]|uniref:ARID/BRIGHT DNA binding domain containing protein n=1 Tax=Acanthamoeba castellanii (strain ATCC 30010 / Neff) TaxID=1257118 RepID=L8GNE5_ACACF|nr:ARID/BRIGHT DNA binding domain containing protein [Acanthamoeba castellanii str. Neff]ELR14273.1 ARID/BRIGHT DNA binding domain containing protein [Acanthamoeba castellanii str. Neff]
MEGDEDQAERKAFLAKLKDYMEKRGTPIDRIPQLGQREVDLFKLYHEVTKRGGLNEVVSNKGMKEKYLFAYERRFFHNLDDDAMVPKRPVGRPRKEERMLRDEGKVREPIAPAYGPGTRRSTRRAASEAAARTSAAIAGERGITGPVGVSAASTSCPKAPIPPTQPPASRPCISDCDYTRTAIPKASSQLKGAWASYHPALRLVALALESESTPSAQVDWALGTLLVLSFEEQLHLSAIPLTGLLDSLLRHARPYHSFLLRALGADDKNESESESDDDSEDEGSEESEESESESDDGEGNDDVAPLAVPTKAERQRGVKVWEIVRNLSCIPENEAALADHRRFVRTVVRLMNLERRLDQRQRRQRRRPTSVKREWVERLSRNALDVYSSVCHHPALAGSATVARAAPALLYFVDSAGAGATSAAAAAAGEVDETVWTAVECLRKLTHEGDNEARLLPFTDALLDALARLLCARDGSDDDEAGEGEGDDERAKGDGGERRRRAGERESEVAELKGAVLAVLLNLAKCSPRTACRLPAHPGLMRRLFGLVATPSSSHNVEPGENDNENENENEDGEADDEEEREEEEEEEEEEREEADVEADDASATLKRKGEEEEEAVKAFLKSVAARKTRIKKMTTTKKEKRAAKRHKVDDAGVVGGEKSEAAPTATSTSATAGEVAPVDGTTAVADAAMEVDQETTKKNENENEAGSEKATPPSAAANGEEKDEEEKPAAVGTATATASSTAARHRVGGGNKRKRRDEGDDGYAGDVVERVRERLRKQAGLVLSKLADDPACCDALRVYDGLVVQAMLLAPHQGPLAPLLHKLLLNIGLAVASSSPTAF